MEDWGEIKLIKIEENDDFWYLIDELWDDNSGFTCNRSTILEAFKKGNLYGLRVIETDSIYKRGASRDQIFCVDCFGHLSWYLLPCLYIKKELFGLTQERVEKVLEVN